MEFWFLGLKPGNSGLFLNIYGRSARQAWLLIIVFGKNSILGTIMGVGPGKNGIWSSSAIWASSLPCPSLSINYTFLYAFCVQPLKNCIMRVCCSKPTKSLPTPNKLQVPFNRTLNTMAGASYNCPRAWLTLTVESCWHKVIGSCIVYLFSVCAHILLKKISLALDPWVIVHMQHLCNFLHASHEMWMIMLQ